MKIAFDVNGTLLRASREETEVMVGFLKILKNAGHFIIVWSSEEVEKTELILEELKINEYVDKVIDKLHIDTNFLPDIAFDDNPIAFSIKATIKV